MSSLALSLWSLESPMTNAVDVFVFWLAITSTLKDLFSKSDCITGITKTLKWKATAIINQRYKAFIDQSPSDIYFTAFFLDPHKPHSKFMFKLAYSSFHAHCPRLYMHIYKVHKHVLWHLLAWLFQHGDTACISAGMDAANFSILFQQLLYKLHLSITES